MRVVHAVVLDILVEVPAFTKQIVKAVFPRLEKEDDLDLSTESLTSMVVRRDSPPAW